MSSVICADPNIRLLVGPERAGIGYGIAGSLCGVIAVAAPMAGGVFMDMDDPNKPLESGVNVAWFFAGTMVLSTLVWLVVSTLNTLLHTLLHLALLVCAWRNLLCGLGWQTLGMCPGLV
eukprot:COSAG06_NODE_11969_length_1441_cov_0.757824_4_plen_119_part_00